MTGIADKTKPASSESPFLCTTEPVHHDSNEESRYIAQLASAVKGVTVGAGLLEPWSSIHRDAQAAVSRNVGRQTAYHEAIMSHLNGQGARVWKAVCKTLGDRPTEQGTPKPKVHWAEEAYLPQPPTDWIVHEILPPGSVSLFVGDPGCGKTWALLDLAVAVAKGEAWLSHPTKQSVVLWVDEESGPRRLRTRLRDVMMAHEADRHLPLAYMTLERVNLMREEDVEMLKVTVKCYQAKLIIIDALADVMAGGDENQVKDVHPVFAELRSIAEAEDAAIAVIHHSNKAGGYRGSTAMEGAVDLMMMVKRKSGRLEFTSVKERDVEKLSFSARPNWEPDRFWLSLAGQSELNEQRRTFGKGDRHVLRYLAQHGPAEVSAIIADPEDCAPATAKTSLYNLRDDGYAERVDDGGQGTPAEYALTAAGEEVVAELGLL